jgi:hypothetical protein
MRFIPNLDNIVFPKKEMLKDEYDEWLARIVCFAFSISPSALIKQVNRASGEQMADTAKEEGLMPLLRFFEAHMSYLIQKYLKQPNLKFAWKIVNRVAPEQQAIIHKTYIDTEVMTPDEVREDLGKDAMTPEHREAAWPTPAAPALPGMNPDGTPILPKGEPAAPAEPPGPTAAEKMLADAIRLLDPSAVAAAIEKAAQSQSPRVVEVRPEVNVEVGDTNVHVPTPRVNVPPAPLAKSEPVRLHAIRTRRMADGSALTTIEDNE